MSRRDVCGGVETNAAAARALEVSGVAGWDRAQPRQQSSSASGAGGAAAGGPSRSASLGKVRYEYRSTQKVWGLPLLHIHVGGEESALRRKARAWVAVTDDVSVGGRFAAGGQLAAAPVSEGLAALGGLSLGGYRVRRRNLGAKRGCA